jgi:hypothetical protein
MAAACRSPSASSAEGSAQPSPTCCNSARTAARVATLETVTCKTIAHSLDATRARLEAAIADRPARHLRRLLSGAGLRLGPPPEACLAASRPSRLAYPTLSAARARNLVRRRLWEAAEERLHFLVWPAAIMRR